MVSPNILLITAFLLFTICCNNNIVAGDDSPCWRLNGRCQYTSESCGRYNSAPLCGGPNNRQCCVSGADRLCWKKYRYGFCQDTSRSCRGGYDGANLCGGGYSRQCCRRL
ncbi:uncharacterized protein LOC134235760 [Saccostrea cucullata]|uniref:uncharacterized protein LOC134235760 n=1 Tax=Saccostrea cuccullata TaxID=36930 RepID=UPI002ED66B00